MRLHLVTFSIQCNVQAVKFSVDPRNSAVFPDFLVIPEINVNFRRNLKVCGGGGGGGISGTIWATGVVHLSKSAEFYQ